MSRQIVAKWLRDMLPKKCANCGATKNLTYHHIVPVSRGGNDVPSNIAVLCPACHAKVHYEKDGTIGHGDLVREWIERAKMKGVKIGRPSVDHEKVLRLIAEKSTQFNPLSMTTETEIMEMAGVKNVCYAKFKRMLIEAMGKDEWPYEWERPKKIANRPTYDRVLKKIRGY